MGFYIYDDIYDGSFTDDEVEEVLKSHIDNVVAVSNLIDKNMLFFKSREFSTKQLTKELTIKQYIDRVYSSNDNKLQTRLDIFILYFANKTKHPITEQDYDNSSSFLVLNNNSTYYSIVSPNTNKCRCNYLKFNGKKVRNFFSTKQIENYEKWCYENNKKHDIRNNKIVNGKTHTAMDLNTELAQKVLTQSVKSGKNCYGLCEDTRRWYTFRCHKDNKYHGYPIDEKDVPPKIIKIIKNKPGNLTLWQLILDGR